MDEAGRSRRLDSWKEIASYLNVRVRTAQRYEERDGLPVYRDQRGSRGAVTALTEEIDAWARARHSAGNTVGPRPEAESVPDPAEVVEETRQVSPRAGLAAWFKRPLVGGAIAVSLLVAGGSWAWRQPEAKGPPPGIPFVQTTGRFFAKAAAEGGRLQSMPLEEQPWWLSFHPSGRELYVSGSGGERLWVVSADTWKVSHQVRVGRQPGKIRLSGHGDLAFVTNANDELVVVDTVAKRVAHRIDLRGIQLRDFVPTPDGRMVYLASPREGVLRYDLDRKQFTLIPGLVCPWSLWLDSNSELLYVGSRCGGPAGTDGHDAVDIVDLRTGKSQGAVSGPPMVAGEIVAQPSGTSFWIAGADACRSEHYDRRGCPVVPGEIFHLFRTSDRRFVKAMGWPTGTLDRPPVPHPDGQRVVFLHGNEDFVESVNGATFRTLEKVAIPGALFGAISPDGRHLVIARKEPASLVLFEAKPAGAQMLPGAMLNYWPGDGAYDDAAGYWQLQPEGTVGFAPGAAGLAFRFDGNGRLKCSSPGFATATGPKTIAAWVKAEAWTGEAPLLSEPATDAGWRAFLDAGGRLTLEVESRPRAVLVSRTSLRAGAWHHFSVVKSNSEFRLYVDGRLDSALPLSGAIARGQALVIAGGRPGKSLFRGLLDEIVIHVDALSAEMIERLYRNGRM